MERTKILIADANLAFREYAKETLTPRNYEVRTCIDGHAALVELLRSRYSAVYLDEHLPLLNGVDAVARLRVLRDRTPVILGMQKAWDALPEALAGKEDLFILAKPVSIRQLMNALEICARRRPEPPLWNHEIAYEKEGA